ncbi:MAG: glycosyltransferase family 4 protein [Ardenticatenaceae bacterium]|nr:glycosyltransferase family 4 protein [Anaerolineales bacterium]MCB8919880.1 glycosyltransferase family 4 protein [Ardenticatenaceae bacterium]
MNIAFVTTFDARDPRRGSGTFYYMSQELARQGHTLHYVGPLAYRYPAGSKLIRRLHKIIPGRYVAFLDPYVGRLTGQTVAQQLAGVAYDLLLTNDVAVAGYTPTAKPVVLYTDVMITHDYSERNLPNARLAGLSPLALRLARQTLRAGLRRADLCVFPAQWVADEAAHYGVDPARVRLIPFGANIDDPGRDPAEQRRLNPGRQQFDLLFVGKDWARKGGDVAVAVAQALQQRGINATLHVVGVQHPRLAALPFVRSYGLLDKRVPAERDQLYRLYRECDAFILPSQSEGFVIAVLEAAAFGQPALAYAAHGVGVVDGVTGVLLPLGAPAGAFADVIATWLAQPESYQQLARQARDHYETSVNWATTIAALTAAMAPLLKTAR